MPSLLRSIIATGMVIGCSALVANWRPILAQEPSSGAPTLKGGDRPGPLTAEKAIQRYEGVYKYRFANSTAHDERFESENILEIVPYAKDKVYFRIHLEFFNAHLCDLHGIASYEDGALVFRDPDGDPEAACTLTIRLGEDSVSFDDLGGNCRAYYCGARGSFSGDGFPTKSRRTITYVQRLRASREYSEAVSNFEGAAPKPDLGKPPN